MAGKDSETASKGQQVRMLVRILGDTSLEEALPKRGSRGATLALVSNVECCTLRPVCGGLACCTLSDGRTRKKYRVRQSID